MTIADATCKTPAVTGVGKNLVAGLGAEGSQQGMLQPIAADEMDHQEHE